MNSARVVYDLNTIKEQYIVGQDTPVFLFVRHRNTNIPTHIHVRKFTYMDTPVLTYTDIQTYIRMYTCTHMYIQYIHIRYIHT